MRVGQNGRGRRGCDEEEGSGGGQWEDWVGVVQLWSGETKKRDFVSIFSLKKNNIKKPHYLPGFCLLFLF